MKTERGISLPYKINSLIVQCNIILLHPVYKCGIKHLPKIIEM